MAAEAGSLDFAQVTDPAGPILAMEPEQICYAISNLNSDYVRGFRDGVDSFAAKLVVEEPAQQEEVAVLDESVVTWGLQATGVNRSALTGRGIRVAILDTGLDLGHPDFAGRQITAKSFVAGQAPQDGHSHGTHCTGTACGRIQPLVRPRYGIAGEAAIFIGKVLSNAGSGGDAGILAGINWAVANRCQIVSMSLGAPVNVGDPFSVIYETAASRALAAGTLIIAAAGNESMRPGIIRPVGRPANWPSIMAVAALDRNFRVAPFSNGGINPRGGQVDIAEPGVDVYSTVPMPTRYGRKSGTSMATPHVAGIAALHAQSNAGWRGAALWARLVQTAQRLPLPAVDVGAGLVRAA